MLVVSPAMFCAVTQKVYVDPFLTFLNVALVSFGPSTRLNLSPPPRTTYPVIFSDGSAGAHCTRTEPSFGSAVTFGAVGAESGVVGRAGSWLVVTGSCFTNA